jgi:glycosyltransferase involved in cell wall biosynthesis
MSLDVVPGELDLSVVLAARNAADDLPLMLDSLAEQRYDGSWEVLVVDNGSTDATAQVARSYAEVLPQLRVLSAPEAPNKAAALNQVLSDVRGRAIVTVDADDSLEPGYLQAMADALDRSDLVGARLEVASVNPPHLLARRRPMQVDGLGTFMRFAPVVIGAGMGVRTRALRLVGGFDPKLRRLSDMDLSFRLQQQGASLGFAPDAVVHYRYREGLRATFWQEVHYAETEALLYRKHRGAGLPRRRVRSTAAAWVRLLLAVPGARTEAGRYRLLTLAGAAAGRVRGSLRERVLYL